jgi:hypothetical protein
MQYLLRFRAIKRLRNSKVSADILEKYASAFSTCSLCENRAINLVTSIDSWSVNVSLNLPSNVCGPLTVAL